MASFNFTLKELKELVVKVVTKVAKVVARVVARVVAKVVAKEVAPVISMVRDMGTVEKLLNYSFKNPTLLLEALTHPSHPSCGPTYERLEFIGDVALALAVSNDLYLTNCQIGPDRLTSLRSANVSTEKLARVTVKHNLYPLVLRNSSDLDEKVRNFTRAVEEEEVEVMKGDGFCDSPSYGGSIVCAPKVLADVVEAIIGAVYVDCEFNLQEMWAHVRGILEPIVTEENYHEQPVSKLYGICQKNGKVIEVKHRTDDKKNIVSFLVDGELLGVGSSEQKSIAKLNAARVALSKLSAKVDTCNYDSNCTVSSNTVEEEKVGMKLLNALCIRKRWLKPVYRIEIKGPAHRRTYKCSVHVQTSSVLIVASGDFMSRLKEAKNNAAYKMYLTLASTIRS